MYLTREGILILKLPHSEASQHCSAREVHSGQAIVFSVQTIHKLHPDMKPRAGQMMCTYIYVNSTSRTLTVVGSLKLVSACTMKLTYTVSGFGNTCCYMNNQSLRQGKANKYA